MLTDLAVQHLWKLVDPDEIGIGIMFGHRDIVSPFGHREPFSIERVVRIPNRANEVYPMKARPPREARQYAWGFTWPALQASAEWQMAHRNLHMIGLVHTHRHGKSLPSALDYRRGKHGMPMGIFHPGSKRLTLYTFNGRAGGRLLSCHVLFGTVPDYCQPAVDLEEAKAKLDRDGAPLRYHIKKRGKKVDAAA